MITYEQVLKVFNKLPISYYCGKKIDVVLSKEEESSFINLVEQQITISYPTIEKYFANQPDNKILEKGIRTYLYHELSHAVATPYIEQFVVEDKDFKDIFNCFEDERIEVIFKDFYLDVNFRWLIKLTAEVEGESPIAQFFRKVRLRECNFEEKIIIETFIDKYSKLNRYSSFKEIEEYQKDIYILYKLLTDQNLSKKEIEVLDAITATYSIYEAGENSGEGRSIFAKLDLDTLEDSTSDFTRRLRAILYRKSKLKGNTNSVMAKTSGRILPSLLCKPNNFKWFESSGEGSKFSEGKIRFNFFIDQSGSFAGMFKKINLILKELSDIEKEMPDFEFKLVTIDQQIELKSKNKRIIETNHKRFYGNSLTPELFKIYHKLQNQKYKVINIIMFNGNAICTDYKMPDGTILRGNTEAQAINFKAFNHSNCIIISDTSNREDINKYCKVAKKEFVKPTEFLQKFEDIILKKIQLFL